MQTLTLKLEFLKYFKEILGKLGVYELRRLNAVQIEQRHVLLLTQVNTFAFVGRLEAYKLLIGKQEQRQIEYVASRRCSPIGRVRIAGAYRMLNRLLDQIAQQLETLMRFERLGNTQIVVQYIAGLRGRHYLQAVFRRVLLQCLEHMLGHYDHGIVALRVDLGKDFL